MATEPGSSDFAASNPSRPTDGLSAAAGDESGKRARRAAQATAKAISRGADYLRENSVRDMAGDAMDVVKGNPGFALIGAIALGFFLGRAFSSRD